MSLDIPLLRKMVEWVEAEEDRTEGREWYQGWWISDRRTIAEDNEFDVGHFCDTAYCVAGKLAVDAGWLPLPGGDKVAKTTLGITSDIDTQRLFDGSNTAADIRRIAEEIAGERL